MRDRLGIVTRIVRGAAQDAVRGLRLLGRASVATIREHLPASVQRARRGAAAGHSQPTHTTPPARAVEPAAIPPARASQATGNAAPPAAAVSSAPTLSADEQAPEAATSTRPGTEPSPDQAVAANKTPPAKKQTQKAVAEKPAIWKKSAAQKAAAAAKTGPTKKAAQPRKATAKKAAPPKISPTETAAPATLPQPPAEVDVEAGLPRRSGTPAEDLEW